MEPRIDTQEMVERFLTYARIETTSSEESTSTPSTECQWDLARLLEKELQDLGLQGVRLDEHAYVYGLLPENLPKGHPRAGQVPPIGFIAHMDVSPAVPGKDVKPQVHKNYQGGPIVLPGDPKVVLTPETDPPLGECKGLDIITSDGTTLLGADDKAGIAVIMAALKFMKENPSFLHGPIWVAFTPDEEVGRGVDKFDLDYFKAKAAYTVDGESLGEIEDETFCADSWIATFLGINVHPGYAKGKMVNSIKVAARFLEMLPKDSLSPETTEKREGYVHPMAVTGNEEKTVVKFLVRDFEEAEIGAKEKFLEEKARAAVKEFPGASLEVEVKQSYRNMKQVIDKTPEVTEFAVEAVRAAGVEPKKNPIRGGTDGARLSFMGIPTPNIFTGGHNFHSKREWVAVQHMEKSAQVVLNLARIWAEKGRPL